MNSSQNVISIIGDVFIKFQRSLLIFSSIFLFSAVCASVFMRYVLKISMMGIEEIILMVAMWSYFLGASNCSHEESHITADVMNIVIKDEKILKVLVFISRTLVIFIAVAFAYYGIEFFIESIRLTTNTPYYRIPYYVGHGSICYGAIIMAIYTISHYITYIKTLFR